MQLRMQPAQIAKPGEQSLAAKQWQDPQPQAHAFAGIDQAIDTVGHFIDQRRDSVVQRLAFVGQFQRLMFALKQRFADEFLQRTQSA